MVSKQVASRNNYKISESRAIVTPSSIMQRWPFSPSLGDSVEDADLVVEYSPTNCQEVGRVDTGGASFEDERTPGKIWSRGPAVTAHVEDVTGRW